MLRANRPWRLALRLMRVLAAAFTAGVFALVTSDIWRLAYYPEVTGGLDAETAAGLRFRAEAGGGF
jgi:hypothetical protein